MLQGPCPAEATAADRPVWSEPYLFNGGVRGITAAAALRRPDTGEPRGVFTADFFLGEIARYLDRLSRGRSRERHPVYGVLSRGG